MLNDLKKLKVKNSLISLKTEKPGVSWCRDRNTQRVVMSVEEEEESVHVSDIQCTLVGFP